MKLSLLAVVLFALVSACASPVPAKMKFEFSPHEHVDYAIRGSASITGQAFLRQKGGGVVTCAGSEVALFPSTPYFKEFLQLRLAGRRIQVDSGALKMQVVKRGQCDANGNFAFNSLAAGSWLVLTDVTWTAGGSEQGGSLLKQVTVSQGQSVQVLLSDKDLVN